jgi:WD40 repeat protein/tetratricopeptide (TPR) repeat protein
MAPERFEGHCDVRSEVYSLGLTLYEALTLRAAFAERDRLALINRVKHEEPPRPCQVDAKIPRDLETIVLKAMAKHPADRYATAAELAEDLRRFLADRPIRARRTPWHERVWRWCRRNPAVASLTALALLLLVTVAVVSTVAAVSLKGERDRATRARDDAEQAERDRRLQLVQALQDRAHAGRMSRRQGQRFASLDALAQAAQLARELKLPPERFTQLRNEAIACLALPDVRLARKWDIWPLGTNEVFFDDAYQRYARADRQGKISIRRVADDVELCHWSPFDGVASWLSWSNDGRYLATANGGTLKVWHFPRRQAVAALPPVANRTSHSFSPDSRQLAVTTRDSMLTLYDLASGRQVKRMNLGGVFGELSFHPKQRWLAMASGNRIRILDLETGQKLGEDLVHPARAYCLVWNPDGRSLAAACDNGKIYVWDLAARRPTAVLEGSRNAVVHLIFNRAGDLLASSGWDGMLRFWHPRTGKQVFSTPGDILAYSFSPDDRQIAARIDGASGSEFGLWEVAAFREYRTLVHDPVPTGDDQKPSYYSCSLHPNGRWLAMAMVDGVRIWDLPSGRQLAWLPIGQTGGVWFEPSGALLTNGASGWWRWPLHADGTTGSRLRIGPPDLLPVPSSFNRFSGSHDGRVLAVPFGDGAQVLHADRPYQPIQLVPHDNVFGVSVSPDGRWVATGSHHGTGIKVWEAATGRFVKDLLVEHHMCGPNFSPDGRWLATFTADDNRCRLWTVGSWEPGIHFPTVSGADFLADSRVLASPIVLGVLALIDPATGREYVRLEDPNQDDSRSFMLTADGSQLVTSSYLGLAIHVWDLRLIRQQLAELGLDWDGPPTWPIARIPHFPRPPVVPPPAEIRGLDLVTNPGKWQQYRHARTALTLALNPFDAEAHFLLGRELLDAGKAAEATRHLTFALTFRPGFGAAYVERAKAAFRLGRWAEAVADASVVLHDQPYDADTLSLRGQAYQKLGRHAEAVADFTAALARYPRSAELQKLRAASYAALGKKAEASADRDQGKTRNAASQRAQALNNQAWRLVTGPDPRDPDKAFPLITEARRLRPNDPVFLNTLGVVQYRLGRYAEAAATLEKSLAASNGTQDAFDLFFLAMCYQHLGDADRARACYDRAVQWRRDQKDLRAEWAAELQAFQAEAEALLRRAIP